MEQWKDVVGFEGLYSVSNQGRVRREKSGKGLRHAGLILQMSNDAYGYHLVSLYDWGLKPQSVKVHRVVTAAFIGPCPKGYHVNHIDGNKQNNAVSNLEYCTPAQNVRHARDVLGSLSQGDDHWTRKYPSKALAANACPFVVYDACSGEILGQFQNIKVAALELGVTPVSISFMLHGRKQTFGGGKYKASFLNAADREKRKKPRKQAA